MRLHPATLGAFLVPLIVVLLFGRAAARSSPQEIVLDRDDIVVTQDAVVKPGTYAVADVNGNGVVQIRGNGITVDFQGARLVGSRSGQAADAFDGVGVSIQGTRGVTVKNAVLEGFRVGIQAHANEGLTIEGCDVGRMRRMHLRSTPEREDGADWLWPHKNDDGEWAKTYGAGIWAKECVKSTFAANRARASQNGIILDRSTDCDVFDNDCSFLSGWGLAMWRSSKNRVSHNSFDWCVRGYSHGIYDRGQDSAGILVFEQCSDNVFAFNSATHGGDGFFLYAGNETLERTGEGGCNGNILYKNDFSHAVANGIEATFSKGNVFAENILEDCSQHGVWGGFSYDTTIVQNRIAGCGGGISIEHGHDNWIEGNEIRACTAGIELWENVKTDFASKPYGKKQEIRSLRNTIRQNVFRGNILAIDLRRTAETTIQFNLFDGDRGALRVAGLTPGLVVERNLFRPAGKPGEKAGSPYLRNETGGDVKIGANAWGGADPAKLAAQGISFAAPLTRDPVVDPKESGRKRAAPAVKGTRDAFLPADARRGRAFILVDEWGPYDFAAPKLWPARVDAWDTATFQVLGAGGDFEVEPLAAPGLRVWPPRGKVPGVVKVMIPEGAPAGITPFELRVKISGSAEPLAAGGTIARAAWTIAYYAWDEKSQDPRKGSENWAAILRQAPLASLTLDRLDFHWGAAAPASGVPADYFATVAETELRVPEGEYNLTTVSDDGIRVLVDGAVVQEDWTWHPPKENSSRVKLAAGVHRIRVEHFEIDGHAALSLTLAAAR